jgi:uncharacterized protein Smg (DUF494 family)
MSVTIRDQAREVFKKSGFTYNDIFDNRDLLKEILQNKLEAHDQVRPDMKLRLNSKNEKYKFIKDTRDILWYELRVDGSYFENRECITLNRDGFVGLCGWADSTNEVPIVEGFMEFLYLLDQRKNR